MVALTGKVMKPKPFDAGYRIVEANDGNTVTVTVSQDEVTFFTRCGQWVSLRFTR